MSEVPGLRALEAFHRAAARVPAYRILLAEAGIDPEAIVDIDDFRTLPVIEKRNTFQRFPIEELCLDGVLGRPASVLTSSGHSGVFAFGVTDAEIAPAVAEGIDELLDVLYRARSRPTLLVNALPMGVKIPTRICTLAETSVRPDMVVGLVRAFAHNYAQIVLVGETAFIKHIVEMGARGGIDWKSLLIHVVVGEEPLAENARSYLETLLGIDPADTESGSVISSMGVAELGLNLFFETPPQRNLIPLRRLLHGNASLRRVLLGTDTTWVPSLFTFDPNRILVEFDENEKLVITTLESHLRIPLIRYRTGDSGSFLSVPYDIRPDLETAGFNWAVLHHFPIVSIRGRGECAYSGSFPVYPEAVKEGIYHELSLVPFTTANFRVISDPKKAHIRVQLSETISPTALLNERFRNAIEIYVGHPVNVTCESYEDFRSGMTLDYERKFSYLSG